MGSNEPFFSEAEYDKNNTISFPIAQNAEGIDVEDRVLKLQALLAEQETIADQLRENTLP